MVKTIENMTWHSSAKYATHDRIAKKGIVEFTGADPDTITFDVVFSVYRGVPNPMVQIERLNKRMRHGEVLPLVIGTKSYGSYRWVVESMDVKNKYYDRRGNVTEAVVSLSLKEYPRK